MSEILVIGDSHGDLMFIKDSVITAKDYRIRKIVQLGDFGYWPHEPWGQTFLNECSIALVNAGIDMYFLPGNHENFDALEDSEIGRSRRDFIPIRDHLFYTQKTNSIEWEGKRIAFVGGAVSIDRSYRVPGKSWWPQEALTHDDLDRVDQIASEFEWDVDILFSHDCPTNAPFDNPLKDDPDSNIHRQMMNQVGDTLRPRLWIHGHMHQWMDYYYGESKVYGLSCNEMAMPYGGRGVHMNKVILDLETLKVTPV